MVNGQMYNVEFSAIEAVKDPSRASKSENAGLARFAGEAALSTSKG
jgi:hypothetical protein